MRFDKIYRPIAKILGFLLLLIAFLFLAVEIVMWLTLVDLTRPLGEIWFSVNPESLNQAQAFIQRYIFPGLWDKVIVSLLAAPAWQSLNGVAFGCFVFGLFLRQIGLPRRRYFY